MFFEKNHKYITQVGFKPTNYAVLGSVICRTAKVEGLNPTRVKCICFHTTRESTEYPVLARIGLYG